MPDISVLRQLLEAHGLVVLGEFSDRLLVGNAGSAFWSCFERSPEFLDNQPHPLDRWSQRIGRSVAAELNARVVFPFQGPPYPPVLKWASESGQAFQSPISMYIHREYGLWHAYRFILVFPEPLSGLPPLPATESPCLSCPDQPCLGIEDAAKRVVKRARLLARTPLTNVRYTGNPGGAIYGYDFGVDNAYMTRVTPRTALDGLYLTGAWSMPGGGFTLPVALVGVSPSGRSASGSAIDGSAARAERDAVVLASCALTP